MQGWSCPSCGKAHGPHVATCPESKPALAPKIGRGLGHIPPLVNPTISMGCPVCGVGSRGETVGYVCVRRDCPGAVTC